MGLQVDSLTVETTLAAPTSSTTAAEIAAAQSAAQSYTDAQIAALLNSAPGALDTLNELAQALGNDPNFASTVNTALANRLRVDTAAQGLSGTQKTNAKTNIDLQNVDNTSDANKPVSTAQGAADAAVQAFAIQRANHTGTQLAATISDFGAAVRGLAITGYVIGANAALSATDTILQAFGKVQGQISALFARNITAGAGLTGGGDLTADRTIAMPNVGTAGTFGSASSVPVITTDAQGRVSGVVGTAISILAAAVSDFANAVRTTLLTGFTVGTNTAIAATDTILQAFGKTQAQINAKANSSVTVSAGTGLNGGGDLTANRTLNHNINNANVGTFGSASSVPVITADNQGHVTGVVSTAIAILSTAVTDFAAAVRGTVLTGLSLVDAAVTAADDIVTAIGKLQGQIDVWTELIKTSADQLTNSATTLTNVTDLSFNATAGRTYYLEYTLLFRTQATTTGIALTLGTSDTAVGDMRGQVNIPIAADGTAALYTGNLTALGDLIISTGVQAAVTNYVATIRAVFICTTGGSIVPQFRSEVAGSNAAIAIGSVALIREF